MTETEPTFEVKANAKAAAFFGFLILLVFLAQGDDALRVMSMLMGWGG